MLALCPLILVPSLGPFGAGIEGIGQAGYLDHAVQDRMDLLCVHYQPPLLVSVRRQCKQNPKAWYRRLRLALEQGKFCLLLLTAPVSQGQQSVDILLHCVRSGAMIQFVPREEGVGVDLATLTISSDEYTNAAAPLRL